MSNHIDEWALQCKEASDLMFAMAKHLAGEHYGVLIADKDSCVSALEDPDSGVRSAAILLCKDYWHCGTDEGFIGRCSKIVSVDPDRGCRLNAIDALGFCLRGSAHLVALATLATIAADASECVRVRNTAYTALLEIRCGTTMKTMTWDFSEEHKLVVMDGDILADILNRKTG